MTGKDLIIYILNNNLEDEPVIKDGHLIGFKTDIEIASKMGVGRETIKVLVELYKIPHLVVTKTFYVPVKYAERLEDAKCYKDLDSLRLIF